MDPSVSPASRAFVVTASDTTIINARALYIGTTGDVTVITSPGTAPVQFKTVPVGFFPVNAYQVMAATTAGNIVGLL